MQKRKHKVVKQVYRVKKDSRLSKNSDLTLDEEKTTIEKSSASSTDQVVPTGKHGSNNIAEQWLSLAGGQNNIKIASFEKTGTPSFKTRPSGFTKDLGKTVNFMSKHKVVKNMPSFEKLLF
jgi:hypothetical protein